MMKLMDAAATLRIAIRNGTIGIEKWKRQGLAAKPQKRASEQNDRFRHRLPKRNGEGKPRVGEFVSNENERTKLDWGPETTKI